MNKQRQFESLVIKDLEESVYHLPKHGHTFYELVYIYEGAGLHLINQHVVPYGRGDLIFIGPADQHKYDIRDRTRFILIKFTDGYFSGIDTTMPEGLNVQWPETIMRSRFLKEAHLKIEEPTQVVLKNLIDNILIAHHNQINLSSSRAVYYQLLSIFGLVADVLQQRGELPSAEAGKENILAYIHEQIYAPDKCRVKVMAAYFNISPPYFSAYFKKQFGISYRAYTNNYRIQLIETRLKSQKFSVKQIAAEFGFTDESHLSNYFKSQKLSSPRNFLKQYKVEER